MSGQQWHPMPCDLIADFATHQWTTANQAPKGVGYLWTWRQMEDGHAPSIRDLARYAGWTRWMAQQVRARVLDDRKTWEAFGSLTKLNRTATGQPPDTTGHHRTYRTTGHPRLSREVVYLFFLCLASQSHCLARRSPLSIF